MWAIIYCCLYWKNQDLVIFLTTLNEEKGHIGQHFYNALPEDADKRALKLLDEIPNIKSTIDFYKALPDGHL